jgi:hypothetical protein
MSYQEVLDRCLAALERGATIEECVLQYPDFAPQLEQTLRLAQEMRQAAKPRMSSAGFENARAAMRARAQLQSESGRARAEAALPSEALYGQAEPHTKHVNRRYTLPKAFQVVHSVTAVTAQKRWKACSCV